MKSLTQAQNTQIATLLLLDLDLIKNEKKNKLKLTLQFQLNYYIKMCTLLCYLFYILLRSQISKVRKFIGLGQKLLKFISNNHFRVNSKSNAYQWYLKRQNMETVSIVIVPVVLLKKSTRYRNLKYLLTITTTMSSTFQTDPMYFIPHFRISKASSMM